MLAPLKAVLSALLSLAHSAVTGLGADPIGALGWCLSIAAIVVVVRSILLPITVHQVRNAHRMASARPHLQAIAKRYRGRTDPESVRAMMAERREISTEHGVSRLGCLPVLIQIPVWIALYHLLSDVARGRAIGALDASAVRAFDQAQVFGVGLGQHGYLDQGTGHLAVVLGLAATAAALSFVTQRFLVRPNTTTEGMPESMQQATQLMPTISAVGMLAAAAVVPVALLVYWVCSQLWTMGQQYVIWRWFPTPGTPAAARLDQVRT